MTKESERQPKIIKINCDRWQTILYYCLIGLSIIAWAGTTFGLLYGEIWWIQEWMIYPKTDWVIAGMVSSFFTIVNIVNLYYISRTIYNNQNLIRFECGDDSPNREQKVNLNN